MKIRSVIGIIAGALLILSAGAHSILGWKAQSEQLATTNTPADVVLGLQLGWNFGGAVMLILGIIVIVTFLKRLRGQAVSTFAPAVVVAGYLGYAAWAAVITGGDPFIVLFIVPGVLLGIASLP